MRVLLDTNALIWLIEELDGRSLGAQAKGRLDDADVVYASPISIVEIRIKTMIGKMESSPDLLDDIKNAGVELCDLTARAADAITLFPQLARHDPFDRMLLAQADHEGWMLLTADKILLGLGLDFVVDATK